MITARRGKTICDVEVIDYFDENGKWLKRVRVDEQDDEDLERRAKEILAKMGNKSPWPRIDSWEDWIKRVTRRG